MDVCGLLSVTEHVCIFAADIFGDLSLFTLDEVFDIVLFFSRHFEFY